MSAATAMQVAAEEVLGPSRGAAPALGFGEQQMTDNDVMDSARAMVVLERMRERTERSIRQLYRASFAVEARLQLLPQYEEELSALALALDVLRGMR